MANRNACGFSLIEVLVAISIMGVLALATTTLLGQSFGSIAQMRTGTNLLSLQHDLQLAISVPQLCKASLAGVKISVAKSSEAAPGGQEVGMSLPGFASKITAGAELKEYGVGVQGLRFSDASHISNTPAGNPVYVVRLTLYAEPTSTSASQTEFAPRAVGLVAATLDATTSEVIDCSGGLNGSTPQFNCTSLGGNWDAAASKCKLTAAVPVPVQTGKASFVCPIGSTLRNYHYNVGNTNNAFFVACEVK